MYDFVEETPLVGQEFSFEAEPVAQVSEKALLDRTSKYDFALGSKSPGRDVLMSEIVNGTEKARRSILEADHQIKVSEARRVAVQDYIEKRPKGSPLVAKELDVLFSEDAAPRNTGSEVVALEREYAKQIMLHSIDPSQDPFIQQTMKRNGVDVVHVMDVGEKIITAKEGFRKIAEEQEEAWKNRTWGESALPLAAALVPFYGWWSTHNATKGAVTESKLPGNNRLEQYQEIARQSYSDPAKAVQMAKEAVDTIAASSVVAALEFSKGLLDYSSSSQMTDNAFAALDVALTAPLKSLGAGLGRVAGSTKAAVRSSDKLSLSGLMDSTGQIENAARLSAVERLRDRSLATNAAKDFDDIANDAVSVVNPGVLLQGGRVLSREQLTRLERHLEGQSASLLKTLDNPGMNPRLSGETLQTALQEAETAIRRQYSHLSDAILDVRHIAARDTVTNADHLGVRLGVMETRVPLEVSGRTSKPFVGRAANDTTEPGLRNGIEANDNPYVVTPEMFKKTLLEEGLPTKDLSWMWENAEKTLKIQKQMDDVQRLLNTGTAAEKAAAKTVLDRAEASLAKIADKDGYVARIASFLDGGIKQTNGYLRNLPDPKNPLMVVPQSANDASAISSRLLVGSNDNLDSVVVTMGTRDAKLFVSPEAAKKAAEDLYGLQSYNVGQHGSGYFIEVTKPLNEVSGGVRDTLGRQLDHSTPRSLLNRFIGGLRSPDHLVAREVKEDLTSSVFGAAEMQNSLSKAVESSLGELKRFRQDSLERFQGFMSWQRDNPGSDGKRGFFSTSQGELETQWMQRTGRTITEAEARAYWSYVQLSDFDLVARNLQVLKEKQRLGLQMWELPLRPKGEANQNVSMPALEGRVITEAPWGSQTNARILLWDDTGTNMARVNTRYASQEDRRVVADLMAREWKLIHLSSTGQKQLTESPWGSFGERAPEYVLAPQAASRPLPLQQIPRRPGGHVEYQDGYFIRQPEVHVGERQMTYYGDNSFFHFRDQATAQRYTQSINEARLLWNDEAALGAYLQTHLPHVFPSVGRFKEEFLSARLNPDIPLSVSRKGESLADTGALDALRTSPDQTLVRFADSDHNLYRGSVNFQYLGERSDNLLGTIINGHPQAADLLDPVSTMIRANNQLMRNRHLGELKIKSAERFLAEFGHTLDAKSLSELRADPMKWLLEPSYRKGADPVELSAAENYRRSVVSLMGTRSELQKYGDAVRQGVVDQMTETFGERGYRIAHSAMELPLIKDPLRFSRSVAFHAKLGLFNLEQFLVQSQNFFNIAAISGPVVASKAMGQGLMMKTLSFTNKPEVMNHVAQRASQVFGGSSEQFLESWTLMRDSGFARVGREFAALGDFVEETHLASKTGRFLNSGTVFFRKAEELNRFTSWNAAYSEFRAANPKGVITPEDKASILKRADTLSGNMTAASDAAIQKNALAAVPLQFLSYQARMTENVMTGLLTNGGNLNRAEASRVLLTQSALYGVPVGAGVAVGVWPVYESWKKYLLDQGIQTDTALSTVLSDGLMAYASELATGTKFNAAERYGAGGVSLFKDILFGSPDERMKALGGASFGVLKDITASQAPVVYAWAKATQPGGYPFKVQDLLDASQSVSSVNKSVRLWYALQYQQIVSKDGGAFMNTTDQEAWTTYITGLMPSDVSDVYKVLENNRTRQEAQKAASREATKNFRFAMQEWDKGNAETGTDYYGRAVAHLDGGGFTPLERARILGDSFKGSEEQGVRILQRYGSQNQDRMNSFIEILRRRRIITESE